MAKETERDPVPTHSATQCSTELWLESAVKVEGDLAALRLLFDILCYIWKAVLHSHTVLQMLIM